MANIVNYKPMILVKNFNHQSYAFEFTPIICKTSPGPIILIVPRGINRDRNQKFDWLSDYILWKLRNRHNIRIWLARTYLVVVDWDRQHCGRSVRQSNGVRQELVSCATIFSCATKMAFKFCRANYGLYGKVAASLLLIPFWCWMISQTGFSTYFVYFCAPSVVLCCERNRLCCSGTKK